MRRLLLSLLACALALAVPSSAFAHDVLEKTVPADGTTVDRVPASVQLVLSDEPLALGLQVVVKGPTGDVAEGAATINGREVSQPVAATAPAGQYTVAYRVTSGDGHPITGSFSFNARMGLDGSTATAAPTVHVAPVPNPDSEAAKESQLVPIVLTAAGALIAAGLIAFVLLRGRRRPPTV